MDAQVLVVRDIHWGSHLIQNMYLRGSPLVGCQVYNLKVWYVGGGGLWVHIL